MLVCNKRDELFRLYIKSEGFKPSLSRIEIITKMPEPKNVREVKRVLGKAGFYRRHIENFASIVEPLLMLTRKSNKFNWGEKQQKSFEQIKELLSKAPNLIFPDYSKPFHIFTDASSVGQGGVLMQKNEEANTFSAIAYCSRTLSASERKWPTVQVELSAIIYSLREFRPYIFMSDIELHTDHKPLAYLLKKVETHPQLARWLIELQNYQIKIVHVSGKQNTLADALSRAAEDTPIKDIQSLDELQDIIDFPVCLAINAHSRLAMFPFIHAITLRHNDGNSYEIDLVKEQNEDPEAKIYLQFLKTGEFPYDFSETEKDALVVEASNMFTKSGILYYKSKGFAPRIYIPISLRALIFESFHTSPLGGGHLNVRKTLHKCKKYFWPRMHTDISNWIRLCITCQLRHSPVPSYRAEMMIVPSNTLFSRVGLDLAGPFPTTKKGNKHILNIVCWFTKYIVSIPIPDAKANTIAKALFNNCYLKYGGFTELITDNATAFTSELFKEFCSMLYINKRYATPHWSQGNAATERTFRTFHNMLAKYITEEEPDYDEYLDAVCFCYNTSVHTSTNETPFFLMFGRDPIFCVDQIIDPNIRECSISSDRDEFKQKLVKCLRNAWECAAETHTESQLKFKEQYDKKVRQPEIQVGDRVLLRNYAGKPNTSKKFHLPWKGIYRVVKLENVHATIVSCVSPQAKPKQVHINQIKKCFESLGPPCTIPEPEKQTPDEETVQEPEIELEEFPAPINNKSDTDKAEDQINENSRLAEKRSRNKGSEIEELDSNEIQSTPENTNYNLRKRSQLRRPKRYL